MGRAAGGMGRNEPGAEMGKPGGVAPGVPIGAEGAAERGPTGGWIGAPRPSIGGRSGMARGLLSSAGASSFAAGFCSSGTEGVTDCVGLPSPSEALACGPAEAPAVRRRTSLAGDSSAVRRSVRWSTVVAEVISGRADSRRSAAAASFWSCSRCWAMTDVSPPK